MIKLINHYGTFKKYREIHRIFAKNSFQTKIFQKRQVHDGCKLVGVTSYERYSKTKQYSIFEEVRNIEYVLHIAWYCFTLHHISHNINDTIQGPSMLAFELFVW